jgi:hypothetical protein
MQIAHLRNVLAEQIELLRHKRAEPKTVNAITNAAGKIISTVRLEFEYARMTGQKPTVQSMSVRFKALPPAKKNGKK